MKNLILLLALSVAFTACQKEQVDEDTVNIIPPQEVKYKVITRTDARKQIKCELWAADLKTHEKRQKVGEIDTITTQTDITLTLLQNVKPVMYCYASLTVHVLDNKYDTFYIEIANDEGPLVYRGGTCETDFYDITDIFLQLYHKQ